MVQSSEWVLKALIYRCPQEKRSELESFLPPAEKERLDAMAPLDGVIDIKETPLLDRIHWSWFLPVLKAHAIKEQKLFLSSLPASFQEPLSGALKMRNFQKGALSAIGERFLQHILRMNITGEEGQLLPLSFLPPSPFFPLLQWDKNAIIRFIDLLSLYDLASELKRIVETRILKKIYSFLSEEEQSFLKIAMAQKQSSPTAWLKLETWDGSEKSLRLLLHKRGLVRFGVALSTQHPDLTWYLCHSLDIGRGSTIEQSSKTEAAQSVQKATFRQAEELLKKGFS